MQKLKNLLLLFFYIISLVINASPPIPEKMYEIVKDNPTLVKSSSNLFKRLDILDAYMEMQNSTLVTDIYDDYRREKHQIIIIPKKLPQYHYFSTWGYTLTDINDFDDIEVSCKILDSTESCNASIEKTKDGEYYSCKFSFVFRLFNEQQLIIEQSHKMKKTKKDILYKVELIAIPVLSEAKFCDYKYTIPDGYKFLGFQDNLLKKESDKIFTYKGECPKEQKFDVIRFSPKQSKWKADLSTYLTSSSDEFKNSIKVTFPRYYRGGKNIISYYKISSNQGREFKEDEIVSNYTNLTIEIPPANSKKLGIELQTAFENKLSNKFDVYFPAKFYQIDESNLDPDIKAKAEQIINNKSYYPGYPNYYKLGRFVNEYLTYDLAYSGKKLTPKQIYNQKAGICEHYTILYNEMLNAIGIETLYVFGWAFQNNETSANKDTIGHVWTVALIDGSWIELDSTWGLMEGISAGHILKGFFNGGISYFWTDKTKATMEENANIVMIKDDSDINAPTESIENNNSDIRKNENSEKLKDDTSNTSMENSSDKKTESDNNSESKEEKDEDDNIRKIRVNKNSNIKFSIISLLLILFVLV